MKRTRLIPTLVILINLTFCAALAQDEMDYQPSSMEWNAKIVGTISHVSFKNWSADGPEYSYVAGLNSKLYPQYSNGLWSVDGSWDGRFSTFGGNSLPPQKTEDRLELNIKAGRLIWQNDDQTVSLHAVLFADLKTQFLPDYDFISEPDGRNYISNFLAPGYLTEGVGIDCRFDSLFLSVVITAIAAKQTMVFDKGVDRTYFGLDTNQNIKSTPGAYSHITFSKDIFPNTNLTLKTLLFADYSKKFFLDLSFFGEIDYSITSFLKIFASLHMVNDNDIKVRLYEDLDADGDSDDFAGVGQRLQLYGQLGVGFTIAF